MGLCLSVLKSPRAPEEAAPPPTPASKPLPDLGLPPSKGHTVKVSVIHGGRTTVPTAYVVKPHIAGHDLLDIPCYSFLVENASNGQKVLFDLGLMKAWREKLPAVLAAQVQGSGAVIDITKDVADALTENGVSLSSINAIIWSHHHMDHTGDPSLFPPSVELVVGPGFRADTLPGFPTNPQAVVLDSALAGRNLREIDFTTENLTIGRFRAIDYFKDGSFYLLDGGGHTSDHLCALARTTDDTFILLGGDVCHHGGELRPTAHLPLPDSISPSPLEKLPTAAVCPGALFAGVHPTHSRTEPFYHLSELMNTDLAAAEASLGKVAAFDASEDVFVVIAHDASLMDVVDFYPRDLNAWKEKGWAEQGRWRFLADFGVAVKGDGT